MPGWFMIPCFLFVSLFPIIFSENGDLWGNYRWGLPSLSNVTFQVSNNKLYQKDTRAGIMLRHGREESRGTPMLMKPLLQSRTYTTKTHQVYQRICRLNGTQCLWGEAAPARLRLICFS